MEKYWIETQESYEDFVDYLKEDKPSYRVEGNVFYLPDMEVTVCDPYLNQIKEVVSNIAPIKTDLKYDPLIFGKDQTENIISISVKGEQVHIYKCDGSVEVRPNTTWLLSSQKLDSKFTRLDGDQHYKWIRVFKDEDEYEGLKNKWFKKDTYRIWNKEEAAMVFYGLTYFKGMKTDQISVLAFDIEAEGLGRHADSKVFLITNTFRDNKGELIKKHFRLDHYNSMGEMINDWCDWVRGQNPDVITGHNIYGYDLPYLDHCAALEGTSLYLGRDDTKVTFSSKSSLFRVDGNTTWSYNKCSIEGREVIDGMFLAVKYDIGKNYPSWGLKQIAEYEGFVKDDRQFYDASKIGQNWNDPVEREKIITYGIDDSDDSLAIYDLMIPSIFYMTQSVPKPFQIMGTSSSGSQLNLVMVRAYLQDGHSIPKASEKQYVAGGMSYGIPGIYKNVVKWDAKSYYPSTVLAFEIYDKFKDPKAYYLKMVRYFTYKRFEQKDQYKQTGDKYYDDMQAASKTFINSAYGLLGTSGLNFNSFGKAQLITKCCRAGLQKAIVWATGKDVHSWWEEYKDSETSTQDFDNYKFIDEKAELSFEDMPKHDWKLVNLDTDALSFCKQDGSVYTQEEYDTIFKELNQIMYSEWEPDGDFSKMLIIKAKNYCMLEKESDKIKKKGSSILDSKRELALREMLDRMIEVLIEED